MPLAIFIPGVRFQKCVLVTGVRLDVAPVAVEDVLATLDQALGPGDRPFVRGVVGHARQSVTERPRSSRSRGSAESGLEAAHRTSGARDGQLRRTPPRSPRRIAGGGSGARAAKRTDASSVEQRARVPFYQAVPPPRRHRGTPGTRSKSAATAYLVPSRQRGVGGAA
jgi:hypothetical protein